VNRLFYSFGPLGQVRGGRLQRVRAARTSPIQDRAGVPRQVRRRNLRQQHHHGLRLQVPGLTSYQDYQTEPVAYYDLSQPLSQIPTRATPSRATPGAAACRSPAPARLQRRAGPTSQRRRVHLRHGGLHPGRHQADQEDHAHGAATASTPSTRHGENPAVHRGGLLQQLLHLRPARDPRLHPGGRLVLDLHGLQQQPQGDQRPVVLRQPDASSRPRPRRSTSPTTTSTASSARRTSAASTPSTWTRS
jgi:hypothetical protein